MKKRLIYITVLLLLFAFQSCEKRSNYRLDKNIALADLKIHRFDLDVIAADTADFEQTLDNLYRDHTDFLEIFVNELEGVSIRDTLTVSEVLKDFVSHFSLLEINEKTAAVFEDISDVENELRKAFSYLKHYFPAVNLPRVYLFVSGLHAQFLSDASLSLMGVGSDFYLGSDYEPYQSLFYDYMLVNMRPEQLPVDLMSNLLFSLFRFDSRETTLLDSMLYHGKVLFLLSAFLPERSENEIIGFTAAQQNWAEKYEKDIWKSVVGNKALFSSDRFLIRKYMEDAPFTAPVSPDSPGRLGEWLGLQIVKSYMKNNKKTTLPELMQMNDYRKMLQDSGY